jgi:hypothetical protein
VGSIKQPELLVEREFIIHVGPQCQESLLPVRDRIRLRFVMPWILMNVDLGDVKPAQHRVNQHLPHLPRPDPAFSLIGRFKIKVASVFERMADRHLARKASHYSAPSLDFTISLPTSIASRANN